MILHLTQSAGAAKVGGMGKILRRIGRGLHNVEWVVSLWEWAKGHTEALVPSLCAAIVAGLTAMSWQDVVPWVVTAMSTGVIALLLWGPALAGLVRRPRAPVTAAEAFLLIRKSTLVPDVPDFSIPRTQSEGLKRIRANHITSA